MPMEMAPREVNLTAFQVRLMRLAEPQRVANERIWQVLLNPAMDAQALFFGAKAQGLNRNIDRFAQVERNSLTLQLAGLDFGEIENIVDQREQAIWGNF